MNPRAMIIGSIGAGKSTLLNALFYNSDPAHKTQSLEFHDWIIDTPGEYSENPLYYRSLMATSFEARLLILVQDATQTRFFYPPGFASGFPVPAIGVITKIDHPEANASFAENLLRQALPTEEIWHTSSYTGHQIEQLKGRILELLARYQT